MTMPNQNPYGGYQPQYAPPPPPPKKHTGIKTLFIVLGSVFAAFVIFMFGIIIGASNGDDNNDSPDVTTSQSTTESTSNPAHPGKSHGNEKKIGNGEHTIVLKASTSDGRKADVSYADPNLNINSSTDQKMPFEVTFTGVKDDWTAIGTNISAQRTTKGGVSCSILWDGKVVSENSASGSGSMAQCSLSDMDD